MSEFKIDYEGQSGKKVKIESILLCNISSDLIKKLEFYTDVLKEKINLISFETKRISETPLNYSYEFESIDGRKWDQIIKFTNYNDINPFMNFDISDFWKMDEFLYHRDVRDTIILLINSHQLTKCKITW